MLLMESIIESREGAYSDILLAHAAQQRVPVQGEIDITAQCNYRCIHCFITLDAMQNSNKATSIAPQLFRRIVGQLRSSGCIWLLITGGEPLTHPHFSEMWRYAWDLGLKLTLFTNGSLITEEYVSLLEEYPPEGLEVSVYSLRPSVYFEITRSATGFERLMSALEMLKNKPFPVTLKTPVLSKNAMEISGIKDFARRSSFGFRMDAVIHPTIKGNVSPTIYRVPADVAANLAMDDDDIKAQLREAYLKETIPFNDTDYHFPCSAGLYSFHIGPRAKLSMCSIYRNEIADLKNEDFADAWKRLNKIRMQPKRLLMNECDNCRLRKICVHCPAIPLLHGKAENFVDAYVCQYTKELARLAGIG
jgi:radical SAM protein with 4Fe4S-binding SPASM domain